MTASQDEHLSALVDEEAGDFEQRRMLDELARDGALREQWSRYHLIGEAMRRGLPPVFDPAMAGRISAAVDAEPAIRAPRRVTNTAWAGGAVAAGAALAAIIGIQTFFGDRAPDGEVVLAETPAVIEAQPATVASAAATGAVTAEEPTGRPLASAGVRLNNYLITHSEHAARPGMLPQVRVVGYAPSAD